MRSGQDAPEVPGGKFASFDQIVLPDWEGVVILATLRGVPAKKNQGIWTTDAGGAMQLVGRTGDRVTVRGAAKIIKSLKIFRVATGVQGQSRNFDAETANLAYQAWFTDGSWAVFRVTH